MDDYARVEILLGRPPRGAFDVIVRDAEGDPVVVRNAPFLDDGTPMPTRYYLVGTELVRAVSRIEAAGGVRRSEADVSAEDIARAHEAYERERDAAIPDDHEGPRPYGGVGGTRQGVKCLHAHLAHALAGGDDPVGRWTVERLGEDGVGLDDLVPPPAPRLVQDANATSSVDVNPDIGGLTISIEDHVVDISMTGGGQWSFPLGPLTLLESILGESDPPRPAALTNALGIAHDHLDDVIVAAPSVAATTSISFTGHHAVALAHVELGHQSIPTDYRLSRTDADEVFRTLVAESSSERQFNPGLGGDDVETILGTLCIVLAIVRRLDLGDVGITPNRTDGNDGNDGPAHGDETE